MKRNGIADLRDQKDFAGCRRQKSGAVSLCQIVNSRESICNGTSLSTSVVKYM